MLGSDGFEAQKERFKQSPGLFGVIEAFRTAVEISGAWATVSE